jgi:regulatory protein YycH of two-component signal transduction system YycFG
MKKEDIKRWLLTILTVLVLLLGLWLMQVNPGGYKVMPP